MANVFVLINPKFGSWDEAQMGGIKGLVEFGQKIQLEDQEALGKGSSVTLVMREFPSWMSFFEVFTSRFVAVSNGSCALFFHYSSLKFAPLIFFSGMSERWKEFGPRLPPHPNFPLSYTRNSDVPCQRAS